MKFSAFNAVYINGVTKVTWSTATETNNDHFDIERSEDGVSFVAIGSISGMLKSNQLKNYAYTDLNATSNSGFLYYRIKQVDKNSQFDYTDIKAVKVPKLNSFTVKSFPNPVTSQLNIALAQNRASATYSLNDISGKTWLRGSISNNLSVDVNNLPRGVYILQVKLGDKTHHEKVIKN